MPSATPTTLAMMVVHAHQRGPYALLPNGNEEIGHKGGKENQIGHLPPDGSRNGRIVQRCHAPGRERQDKHQRKQEHPLHQRHHAVPPDNGAADAQVEGKAQRVQHHQRNAHGAGMLHSAGMCGLQYQPHHAAETQRHAPRLLPSDGLFEEDGGHKHGHDGGDGVDHRQVDGGRHGDGVEERHLRQYEAEDRCPQHAQQVAPRHPLPLGEKAQQPEQRRRAGRPESEKHRGRQLALVGYVLTKYDVEPKDGIGPKTGQMADKLSTVHEVLSGTGAEC